MRRLPLAVFSTLLVLASYACVGEDPRPPSTTIIVNDVEGGADPGGGDPDAGAPLEAGRDGAFDGGPRDLIVFVTREEIGPTSIGADLTGADAFCEDAASTPDSLVPTSHAPFVAWLSLPEAPAWMRLPTEGRWMNMQGEIVATHADLRVGMVQRGIALDETREYLGGAGVWTGTKSDGSHYAGLDCDGWSGMGGNAMVGAAGQRDATWTAKGSTVCTGTRLRLYCFETAPK